MLHIICHQGAANWNKIPRHTYEKGQNAKQQQHHVLVRMWSNRNAPSLLVGKQNGTATLEDSLVVVSLPHDTEVALLGIHPNWPESLCSHKNLHTNIYGIFIHNCQNRKVSKMPFSRWLGKYTAVHSDNGVWLSAKKKQSIKSWKDMKEP